MICITDEGQQAATWRAGDIDTISLMKSLIARFSLSLTPLMITRCFSSLRHIFCSRIAASRDDISPHCHASSAAEFSRHFIELITDTPLATPNYIAAFDYFDIDIAISARLLRITFISISLHWLAWGYFLMKILSQEPMITDYHFLLPPQR